MRLDEDPPCVKFHDNMTKQRLGTVFNVSTKIARGKKAQDLVLKADNNLFSHIILVAESRKENIKDAGRRTWRMFLRTHGPTAMGIGKCWWVLTKNKQGCTCQRAWKECVSCRTHTNSICFHHWWDEPGPKNDWQQQTYTQVAELALTQVLHESVPSNRIGVVFDAAYRQTSIKPAERLNGVQTTLSSIQEPRRGTRRPAMEKILVQSVQQDQSHQVSGGTVETPTIQTNAATARYCTRLATTKASWTFTGCCHRTTSMHMCAFMHDAKLHLPVKWIDVCRHVQITELQ